MKVMVIPIEIGAFGTVTKDWWRDWRTWKKEYEWRPSKTSALLRSAGIQRRALKTWGDMLSLKLQWENISLRWCEKRAKENNHNLSGQRYIKSAHIYEYDHHHHHVVPLAQISLTLPRHFSLSFIASGRSSGLHPVSSHSCWMYVQAGRPIFAQLYMGVHRSKSHMSSSMLLQQCPACLVCLTWIVFMMEGRWPYSWCFVGFCRQDLFKIAHIILV